MRPASGRVAEGRRDRDEAPSAGDPGRIAPAEFESVFQAVPALLFVLGADDTYQGYSAGGSSQPFVPPAAFLGRRVDEVLPPAVGRQLLEALARARATGRQVIVQYELEMPGGPTEYEARLVPLEGGRVAVLVLDLTDRRRAEESVREADERFRVAFQMIPDAVNISRLDDGVYVAVNDGFVQISGWPREEVEGRTSEDLGLWVDRDLRARLIAGVRERGFVRDVEARFRRKDGTILTGVISSQVVTVRGRPYLLSVTRDITERKRAEEQRAALEEQLRQAQKMEAIGRLAGGVAHDFNNLLVAILSYAELLAEGIREGRPSLEDVAEIRQAGERARDLTAQLLAFARRQVVAPRPLDLNELVRDSEKLLRRVLREDVALKVAPQEGLWPVLADRAQLQQVVMNLVLNARDAMPEGGTVTVRTANLDHLPGEGEGSRCAEAGGCVLVEVSDTGHGLSAEARTHLFEPFYTTKSAGQGTGLGLATVYGIVEQAGGCIRVESAPRAGTSFRIYLPRCSLAAAPEPPPVRRVVAGTERVLVVEDDPAVRRLLVRTLAAAGYEVLQACDGREALALAASLPTPFQLLVTDAVMPGMSGKGVADAICARDPDVRVLYVSGYPEDVISHRGALDSGVQFLAKPFTPEGLLVAVREALEHRPAPGGAAAPS